MTGAAAPSSVHDAHRRCHRATRGRRHTAAQGRRHAKTPTSAFPLVPGSLGTSCMKGAPPAGFEPAHTAACCSGRCGSALPRNYNHGQGPSRRGVVALTVVRQLRLFRRHNFRACWSGGYRFVSPFDTRRRGVLSRSRITFFLNVAHAHALKLLGNLQRHGSDQLFGCRAGGWLAAPESVQGGPRHLGSDFSILNERTDLALRGRSGRYGPPLWVGTYLRLSRLRLAWERPAARGCGAPSGV